MTIERESSLNYVTKNLYGKKDKLQETVRAIFWVTTVLSLLLLGFSKAYVCLGVYFVINLSILIAPKYLTKKCNYLLPDALKWVSLMVMPILMVFSGYVFACDYLGEVDYSSLLLIIPIALIVSALGLYFGLRKMSKTTKVSKTLLASASGGLSFWFYYVVISASRRLLKNIPLVIISTLLSCMMLYYLFYMALPLLYAVIKYKFTWDDIDTLGNSLK